MSTVLSFQQWNFGISGTVDTHEYHLELIVKKGIEQRGFVEIIDDDPFVDPYPEQPIGYFIVQMDKSTCQTYNLKNNFLGYRGVPTVRTTLLLEEIADSYGVFILVIPQATHIFDVNGCDALHSVQKKRIRSFPAPLCTDHIVWDWKRACDEVCHHRTIQRCYASASSGCRWWDWWTFGSETDSWLVCGLGRWARHNFWMR